MFNNDLTKIGEATLASNGSYNISIPSAGTYYVWVSIKVKMSLRFISPREGDTVTGNVQAKLSAKGIFSQQCTIVGCDGIYSYWGPMDYFYMKKNSAGQLDIKMRGNVQIMRRDGTVLVQ